MSEDNLQLRFDILDDAGEVAETRELDRDVVKVGNLASSHLRLDRESVSRIHAVIERSGDGSYSIIDLGSAEGTYVNGEQVSKSEVGGGDVLGFGDARVRLEFVESGGSARAGASASGAADAGGSGGGEETVTTENGRQVTPYTLEGYYDDGGNYIPGYYDEHGSYHLGYGYYDDQGQWRVAYGYYDPQGEWVSTEEPVESAVDAGGGGAGHPNRPSDRDEYTHAFFEDRGGDTLEIAQIWGDHVLSVESFPEGSDVSVGPDEGNDFQVGENTIPGDRMSLVVRTGGQYHLVVTDRMEGFLRRGDQEFGLQELARSNQSKDFPGLQGARLVPIDTNTSARVEFAGNTFLLHFTRMPDNVGAGAFGLSGESLPYQGISAAAHLLFLFLCMSLPGTAADLDLNKYNQKNKFVEMMVKPEQKKKKEKKDNEKKGKEKAAKHKGEKTKAGKEDSKQKNKKMAVKGPPDNKDTQIRKERNKKVAQNAGIMKTLRKNSVASKWGSGNQSIGSDAAHALGNLDGDAKGNAKGFGGFAMKGAGRGGGGGVSAKGMGIGKAGSGLGGGGGRGGTGYGKGKQDLGNKGDVNPEVVPRRPNVKGALDKKIIQRVVRQNRREIKYCYEKQLAKNPDLEGTVKVRFTISANGAVISAPVTSSTLGNTAVESCISGKIKHWQFPEPKGNGIVKVNYPFNFSAD